MNSYALRIAIAVLTFTLGVIAASALLFHRMPTTTILPVPLTSHVTASPPSHEATPMSRQERSAFPRRAVGYVKDREGHPVAGAEVCANPYGPVAGKIPCGESEADGSFTLDVWWPDTYTISAEHLAEGYPNANSGFYGNFFGELPVITAGESNDLRPVEVRVGPKAGRVVFKIVDDDSGRRVKSGLVKLCRTDDAKMCMSMSTGFPGGKYELLAPEVPFTIKFEVWGKGQEWEERDAVGEDGEPVELLQVGVGARKEMMVRLRRVQRERS